MAVPCVHNIDIGPYVAEVGAMVVNADRSLITRITVIRMILSPNIMPCPGCGRDAYIRFIMSPEAEIAEELRNHWRDTAQVAQIAQVAPP